MQCLAPSLIVAHCKTTSTNPGDKYPHSAMPLVALWSSSWWWSHSPDLCGCRPADRPPRWALILETLPRFKIKTQQFAAQSHWEASFDLMVICYIHFNSTGFLKWWPLFCQLKKRKTSIDIWVKSYPLTQRKFCQKVNLIFSSSENESNMFRLAVWLIFFLFSLLPDLFVKL